MTLTHTTRSALAAAALLASFSAFAADEACSNRGDLDAQFCDADKDLVADLPTDPKKI
ncbi:MAG: phosphate/phosphite/phosphonate ABC transporter substrate-binding protein, partial [Comamonas sp.]